MNNAVRFVFGHLRGAGNGTGEGTDREASASDWQAAFDTNGFYPRSNRRAAAARPPDALPTVPRDLTAGPSAWLTVLGYVRTIQHALPVMRKNGVSQKVLMNDQGCGVQRLDCGSRGSIVNIASVSAFIAQKEFVPYNTCKGAVAQLTRCVALDFADERVRVNAIAPGSIDTQGAYGHMKLVGTGPDGADLCANGYAEGKKLFGAAAKCAKRMAAPDEIASAALFLASDEASYISGEMLVVDGGLTI